MFRLNHHYRAFSLCSGLIASLLVAPLQAEPLLLVGDEWCPYNCAQTDAQQGYLVDLLREIFSQANLDVEYRVVPWSRAIKMVQDGKANALLATTLEGTPDLSMSQAIGEDRSCYYAAKHSLWQVPTIEQLQQMRLGVIQDYSYDAGGPLDTYIASKPASDKVVSSSGASAVQKNFAKIVAKRVDLVVENCNAGDYSLQHYGLTEQIRNVGDLGYYRAGLYIGFNPKEPQAAQWIKLINNGIRNKRRNGELQKILQRYGLTDWVKSP